MNLQQRAASDTDDLGGGLEFWSGTLPQPLVWDEATFEEMWALHPGDKNVIHLPGGPIETPR